MGERSQLISAPTVSQSKKGEKYTKVAQRRKTHFVYPEEKAKHKTPPKTTPVF